MFKLSLGRGVLYTLVMVCCAAMTTAVMARGGHGGGFHGGGFHGGGFHGGGFHGGGRQVFHPYRPSQHHFDHHFNRHDHHAYNHHYHNWHHGGWGPGFWGGAALGYGLGYEPWAYGGDTYIDNTTEVSTDADDNTNEEDFNSSTSPANNGGFATDDWPELGINTYAGQYGGTLGQVVVRVVPNSAAARAGIVPGDVILSLNGKPTPSADAMDSALEGANLKFNAEVWDARTGRKSTLSGSLDPNAPTTPKKTSATNN